MGGSFSETWGSRTGANSRGNSGYYIYIYIFLIFIYLFLDVLGLCCYVWVFSSCSELGLLSSYSAQAFCSSGFSCCRAWAVGTWASVVVHGLRNDLLKCFLVSLKAFKDKLVMFHAISKHLKRITKS